MSIHYQASISVEDYNRLRKSAGWNELEPEQAVIGLRNSALVVAACAEERTIGMARLISDGGNWL